MNDDREVIAVCCIKCDMPFFKAMLVGGSFNPSECDCECGNALVCVTLMCGECNDWRHVGLNGGCIQCGQPFGESNWNQPSDLKALKHLTKEG